jgi:hypothetical protein
VESAETPNTPRRWKNMSEFMEKHNHQFKVLSSFSFTVVWKEFLRVLFVSKLLAKKKQLLVISLHFDHLILSKFFFSCFFISGKCTADSIIFASEYIWAQ